MARMGLNRTGNVYTFHLWKTEKEQSTRSRIFVNNEIVSALRLLVASRRST
jgi:hypothetical protein